MYIHTHTYIHITHIDTCTCMMYTYANTYMYITAEYTLYINIHGYIYREIRIDV